MSADQFRGFDAYGIGPVGFNGATRYGLGGNYFAVARLEAEFPIGLPAQYNVHGGAFLDIGSVWGVDNPTPDVIDTSAVRVIAGVSMFWGSPIGPLRLNFATPVQVEAYDDVRRFDLTIATRF
jgi:outer membrane protein insertion porin family